MHVEDLRAYLLAKPGATEELPFGPQALVFKVKGKMFALVAWDESPVYVSLKCDPDRALELRAVFSAVRGAYHFNKKHWNLVVLDGSVPTGELEAMIDESYDLVVRKLTKKERATLSG